MIPGLIGRWVDDGIFTYILIGIFLVPGFAFLGTGESLVAQDQEHFFDINEMYSSNKSKVPTHVNWIKEFPGEIYSVYAGEDENLYVIDDADRLICLDNDGELKWRCDIPISRGKPVVSSEGMIYY